MPTECTADLFGFTPVEKRAVVAGFDGGRMTSDAGALLLGATDQAIGLVERFAGCFTDGRAAELIEDEVRTLVGQRVFGIALGYEDLIDHDHLRHDPTMPVLAGKSTLNRLELGKPELTRYHRIVWDGAKIEALFVDLFLKAHREPPQQRLLSRLLRLLLLSAAVHLQRPASAGGQTAAGEHRRRGRRDRGDRAHRRAIRARWPAVRIVLRADSEFAREALMKWCELNGIDFLFGLAKNERLVGAIAAELAAAEEESKARGQPARRFKEFRWSTRDSWSCQRRVIAKAEWTADAANPRFVVTSLSARGCSAATAL